MKITLATLPEATAQQVFDQVAEHLLRQGKISGRGNIRCYYRGDDGLMCAAGCLISDGEYSSELEGHVWQDLVMSQKAPAAHMRLIDSLQMVHDVHNIYFWPESLTRVAQDFNLSPVVVTNFRAQQ